MKNSKLFRTISVLTKSEIDALEKQLKGQFSTQKDQMCALFQYLKKELAPKDIPNVAKEDVFKKVFPKQIYDDGKMRKLMYELMQQVQAFMIANSQQKPFVKERIILDFYHEHYATKEYSESFADLVEKWNEYPTQDMLYWKTQAKIQEYKSHEMAMQYVFKDNMNVPNVIHYQTIVFFIQQLKQHFFLLANKELSKEVIIHPFFYQILAEIETNPIYLRIELLKVYYNGVILLLDKENDVIFGELRQMIIEHSPILTITDWAHIAFAIRNYANRKKATDERFHQIHFDLYVEHLPLGFVFSNNHISPQAFINIVKIGVSLGFFAKVKTIFEEHQTYLPTELKDNILQLSEAFLLHGQKQYQASLNKLLLIEKFEHYPFELDIRVLKIMNSCLLKDIDFCIQQVNAFKIFLHRNEKMSENRKERHRNFAKIVQRYCEILGEDSTQKMRLYQEIQESSMLAEKKWLSDLFF